MGKIIDTLTAGDEVVIVLHNGERNMTTGEFIGYNNEESCIIKCEDGKMLNFYRKSIIPKNIFLKLNIPKEIVEQKILLPDCAGNSCGSCIYEKHCNLSYIIDQIKKDRLDTNTYNIDDLIIQNIYTALNVILRKETI